MTGVDVFALAFLSTPLAGLVAPLLADGVADDDDDDEAEDAPDCDLDVGRGEVGGALNACAAAVKLVAPMERS